MNLKQTILEYGIPKVCIARIAYCQPYDVSRFLASPEFVTPLKAERIENAVRAIADTLDRYLELQIENNLPRVRPNLSDVDELKSLIEHFHKVDELKRVAAETDKETLGIIHSLVAAVGGS
jgi:hypothetical protein